VDVGAELILQDGAQQVDVFTAHGDSGSRVISDPATSDFQAMHFQNLKS
jgi:hypothetical protein